MKPVSLFILFCAALMSHAQETDCRKAFFREDVMALYDDLGDTTIDPVALEYAVRGYVNLIGMGRITNNNILTLVDFGKTSDQERFWVIDMKQRKVQYRSLVAHGMNSGSKKAYKFSNTSGSHQSSLGFYITGYSFDDKKLDYCMKLKGQERSNSKAWVRGIIVHKAWYAEPDFLEKNGGVLGRSFGCPALPSKNYCDLINTIRDGSCFFIYHPTTSYLRWSWILNQPYWLEGSLASSLSHSLN